MSVMLGRYPRARPQFSHRTFSKYRSCPQLWQLKSFMLVPFAVTKTRLMNLSSVAWPSARQPAPAICCRVKFEFGQTRRLAVGSAAVLALLATHSAAHKQ